MTQGNMETVTDDETLYLQRLFLVINRGFMVSISKQNNNILRALAKKESQSQCQIILDYFFYYECVVQFEKILR